ncbi:MAG: hypothetical protein VB071_15015 [Lawsonibacter sp.]|nr:hypothetical protein [Lawsonibacter sp.]
MIIKPTQILDAVREQLQAVFPGETVYDSMLPQDFVRPASMVALTGMELDALGAGVGAVTLRFHLKITTYCVLDVVKNSNQPTLNLRCMSILGAFAAGYIKTEGRAPKLTACTVNTDGLYDCAEVKMTFSLSMDRSEFSTRESVPMMRNFTTKINVEEN